MSSGCRLLYVWAEVPGRGTDYGSARNEWIPSSRIHSQPYGYSTAICWNIIRSDDCYNMAFSTALVDRKHSQALHILRILGLTNSFASIPGFVAPYLASAMTPNVRFGEWYEWNFNLHHSEHTVWVVESVLGVSRHFMLWCCLLRHIWFRRTAGMGCGWRKRHKTRQVRKFFKYGKYEVLAVLWMVVPAIVRQPLNLPLNMK